MTRASLELCKELYELSGWDKTDFNWCKTKTSRDYVLVDTAMLWDDKKTCPAYDLGFLLRKLPAQFGKRGSNSHECLRLGKDNKGYLAGYIGVDLVWGFPNEADTPEDAVCKLAIELFKQGVLKK